MLKNVSLCPSTRDGRDSFRLIGPGGEEIEAFALFADALSKKARWNTTRTYCHHLAQFVDYLYEAALLLIQSGEAAPGALTRELLQRVIESYDDYLVLGARSGNSIAQLVAARMPSPMNARQTSAGKHAAIRRFLTQSEHLRQQTLDLIRAGVMVAAVDYKPLLDGIGTQLQLHHTKVQALTKNSVLGGAVSGGPQTATATILPIPRGAARYNPDRAFPLDRIVPFIKAAPTFRERTLYSFLAASGAREHEGLQLLRSDIDPTTETVRLIDPASRANIPSYLYLTPSERKRLFWKGRATPETFLIEPFLSLFFENLEQYLKSEYIPHGRHDFLFQYSHKSTTGRPYFLSAYQSRHEIFESTLGRTSDSGTPKGVHALRHSYGTYMVNYCPCEDGSYGLPLSTVQIMMGHESIKQTAKYARLDAEIMRIELEHANAMTFQTHTPPTLVAMKIAAYQARIDQLRREQGLLG